MINNLQIRIPSTRMQTFIFIGFTNHSRMKNVYYLKLCLKYVYLKTIFQANRDKIEYMNFNVS